MAKGRPKSNKQTCLVCGAPRWTQKGTTYGRCETHQKQYWLEHNAKNRPAARRQHADHCRIVVINPDTNRALEYEVIQKPAIFVVPEDNAEFSRQLRLARERGVIVTFALSEDARGVDHE